MRLFVAFDIPAGVRTSFGKAIDTFRPVAPGFKWIAARNLHLTLKFIGEQPEERLPAIAAALATTPFPAPLNIGFAGLGFFPDARRPRVFWAGVDAPGGLTRLVHAIERALAPLGIAPEDRAYSPHLTLARARDPRPQPQLEAELARHGPLDFGRFEAHSFALYQSKLSSAGSEYSKLREFPAGPVADEPRHQLEKS